MSLTKIPCILAATIGLYCSFTPPNVATKGEQTPRKGVSDHVVFAARSLIKPICVIVWAIGIAEITVIVTNQFLSPSLSEPIISKLLPRRDPQELRLTPVPAIGALLITLGSLLREICYHSLGRFFTFELSIRKGHRLITTGPYGVVRHPSYTGAISLFVGTFCWYGSRGSWLRVSGALETIGGKVMSGILGAGLVGGVLGGLMRIPIEESMLKENFGEEWVEWAQRVPYLLVPGVF